LELNLTRSPAMTPAGAPGPMQAFRECRRPSSRTGVQTPHQDEPHTLVLEGTSLELIVSLMKKPPIHCNYLFHGPRCAPGHRPSKRYGCVGDFKRAWRTALKAAGLPVGRKHGGFVFHHTRNTAVTNLRASGLEEADCMQVTGHQTARVFRHHDCGVVEALRQRIAAARTKAATLRPLHSVSR
jgi:hypothetical protein